MKVLQINNVYDFGSTGKITKDIHTLLPTFGVESVVCYGRKDKSKEPGVYRICNDFYSHIQHFKANVTGVLYGGCGLSTRKLIKIIEKEKPDIVHLQCLNNYFVNIYKLLKYLKKRNIKTVLTLHAEFMYTGGCSHSFDCEQWSNPQGCGHPTCPLYKKVMTSYFGDRSSLMWKKMKEAFDGFSSLVVVSVSPWLMERAKRSSILMNQPHEMILNGLDTKMFRYQKNDDLRKQLGLEGKKIIFHATPNFNANPSHIKGGYYVLSLAKRLTDVIFVVAGEVTGEVEKLPNVIFLGKVLKQNKLASFYSMADLTLLTSKRETFSMICAESLCCGTPVVGFMAGAPEQISIKEYCVFVEYGDLDALENSVVSKLKDVNNKNNISLAAINAYSKEKMMESYLSLYKTIVNKNINE